MAGTSNKKGRGQKYTQLYSESLEARDKLEDLQTQHKNVKNITRYVSGICKLDLTGLGQGHVLESCETRKNNEDG